MSSAKFEQLLKVFIEKERLPNAFAALAQQWYWPLSRQLLAPIKDGELKILGVSGCQGSGKTTLARLLTEIYTTIDGIDTVNVSIDDFYLTRQERTSLAEKIHPLFQTRGVPGTHDVSLAINTLTSLTEQNHVAIPRFNKAIDDRFPSSEWPVTKKPVKLVIFEGWCIGLPPQNPAEVSSPINPLEQNEDGAGTWRNYINDKLHTDYKRLWKLLDKLVFLRAPDFNNVFAWRMEQEQKLRESVANDSQASHIMSDKEVERFISHYQRLTQHALATLPAIADITFQLDAKRQIVSLTDNLSQ